MVTVYQTNAFSRAYKKLSSTRQADVDHAVAAIVADPRVGEAKKGDLRGVYVYKFKSSGKRMLLAYEYDPSTRMLLLLGSHEIFYQELKR